MKNFALFVIAVVLTCEAGCGGGGSTRANLTPTVPPTSSPTPPPTTPAPPPSNPTPPPPPTNPTPPPDPTPPTPPDPNPPHPPSNPEPPPAPTPVIVAQGSNVMLNVVNGNPLIAYQDSSGTHVGSKTYQGQLLDFQLGVALSTQSDDQTGDTQVWIDGQTAGKYPGVEPAVLAQEATVAAWTSLGSLFVNGTQVPTNNTGGDYVGLASSPNHVTWVYETQGCEFFVDGVSVAKGVGCPDSLKLVETAGATYVGWSDGAGVTLRESGDGQSWTTVFAFTGKQGVFGMDFALRADGSVIAAWTQYTAGEDGSSVWSWTGGSPLRLSDPVRSGFSGAGNPAVAPDGSIAYLDDSNGSFSGQFDVWLDGIDLSNGSTAIDEGPRLALLADGTRVVAWDDEATVWMEEVPQ